MDDVVQLFAAASAALFAALRAGRERGRLRWSWRLIAAGAGSWAAGQAIWTYFEVLRLASTPFPSLADAGYLGLPVLALAGILVRPSRAFAGRGRARTCLDVVLVVVSLFTISWASSLGSVYRDGGGSVFARSVALAYPAGDIALLTVIFAVLAYSQAAGRLGLVCMGGGLAALAVADSGFAYLTAVGGYATGNLIDACWVAGFLALAWSSVLDRFVERRPRGRNTPYSALLLPYVPSLGGIVVALLRLGPGRQDTLLVAAAAVMTAILLIRQAVVVVDNARLADRMRYQALHDPLTGLANRAQFNDRLLHALELRRREPHGVAVLLIDLDDFKEVNDTLGHPAGDELLVEVARRLRASTRTVDTVARLGGDEFAVLVEAGDPREVAQRVLAKLAVPVAVAGRQVPARASLGVATIEPDQAVTMTEVLQRADLAMYAAKRSGKGVARVYSSDMSAGPGDRVDMPTVLRRDADGVPEPGLVEHDAAATRSLDALRELAVG